MNSFFLLPKVAEQFLDLWTAFLALRGIKTLDIRVKKHCENAKAINDFLSTRKEIKEIFWPGRAEHKNHKIAKKQMKDFGGMISFNLINDNFSDAVSIISNTKYFKLAESLGGVESLISHPASMTHASIPKEERDKKNLKDSLIRLSVGIEDQSDLINDLKNALDMLH